MSVARVMDPSPVPVSGFFSKAVMARGHSTLKRISPDLATPTSVSTGITSKTGGWRKIVGRGVTTGALVTIAIIREVGRGIVVGAGVGIDVGLMGA